MPKNFTQKFFKKIHFFPIIQKSHRSDGAEENTGAVVVVGHDLSNDSPHRRPHEDPERCQQVGVGQVNDYFSADSASRRARFEVALSDENLIDGAKDADNRRYQRDDEVALSVELVHESVGGVRVVSVVAAARISKFSR